MNQPEEWRSLAWAPNYEFSSLGRVRRTTEGPGTFVGRILAQSIANGYWQLNLSLPEGVKTRKVHRLICEAFHGPPPSILHQAAHGDGDRKNNRADNLRWATPVENSADDLRNGVRPMRGSHPLARLTEADVEEIRGAYRALLSQLAEKHGIRRSYVRTIIAGKSWATRRQLQPPALRAD